MKKMEIYRVKRANGGTDITTTKPSAGEYDVLYRLIADKKHFMVCGGEKRRCVETDNPDAWEEMEEMTDQDYIQAAKIMLGEV